MHVGLDFSAHHVTCRPAPCGSVGEKVLDATPSYIGKKYDVVRKLTKPQPSL